MVLHFIKANLSVEIFVDIETKTKAGCPVAPWYQKYVKNASFEGIPHSQSLSIKKITTPSSGGCKFAFVDNTGWF